MSTWKCEHGHPQKGNIKWVRYSRVKVRGKWETNKPVPICQVCVKEGRDGIPSWARG